MIQVLEEFLASNAGIKQVNVDGTLVTFDRAQAINELNYWQREAAKKSGKRKTFRGVNLGTAW